MNEIMPSDIIRISTFMIYLYCDFKLLQAVRRFVIFRQQCSETQYRIFLYSPYHKKEEAKQTINNLCIATVVSIIISPFIMGSRYEVLVRLMLLFFSILLSLTYSPERHRLLESRNLNLGYGAALWYYENYLKLFLPDKFLERIEQFKSYNKVCVEKKLFILVPKSCKIPAYLDCDTDDCIERCKELPKHLETLGGVKNRSYNITVYGIKKEEENEWLRLAVEYAQPLKALHALKEKHVITEEEMFRERTQFVLNMQNFLNRDHNNSYKFCELVEYDDEERTPRKVLLERCSLDKTYYEV